MFARKRNVPTLSLGAIGIWVLIGAAPSIAAVVVFEETFESYADQTDFATVWSEDGSPPHLLDTTFGRNSNQSIELVPQTSGGGITNRWFLDLSTSVAATDGQPIRFSFDFFLDPAGENTLWADDWQLADIRAFGGGAFGQGTLDGLVAMGIARTASGSVDILDTTAFQGRVIEPGNVGPSYYSLNDLPTAVPRSSGWHHLEALIGDTTIHFSVDGQPAESVNVGVPAPFTTVILGSDIPNNLSYWVDNIRLEVEIPEPLSSSLMLFAANGILVAVHRRRSLRRME